MADYSNQGVTFSAVMSTVGIGTDTMGVKKVKAAGMTINVEKGYELGNPMPVTFVDGRVDIDNMTVSVRLAEWERWADANPRWATTEYPVSVSLRGRNIDTRTINVPRARLVKNAPTELDVDSTGEALADIEVSALDVRTGDRRWFQ